MAGAHLREEPRSRRPAAVLAGCLALAVGAAAGFGTVRVVDESRVETGSTPGAADNAGDAPAAVVPSDPGTAIAVPDAGPVTLAFVGDINTERSLAERLEAAPADFVGPFADLLRSADLAVGNLEAAIATGGSALDKEFTFRSPPPVLDALRAGGLDVVSVANNHGIDFGPEGFAETVATKRAQPDGMVIGAGANEAEAYAPHRAVVGGQRIAVIAATQVIDAELIRAWTATADTGGLASAKRVDRLVAEIESVRPDADTVVVYLHWGTEGETCPNDAQRELAQALVDAGADVIVGGHAHRVQGAGRLDGAFVGYGLGNFLFGAVSPESADTGVLLVEVDGREVLGYEWRPGRIVDRVPQPLEGEEAVGVAEAWHGRRDCTGLAP